MGAGIILLFALVWRLLGVTDTQVWRDEAVTLVHTHGSWCGLMTRLPWVEDSPPLGFLIFKLWSLAGNSELWFRILPVLVGVGTVAVLMAAAQRMRPGAWGIVGVLAAFSHGLVHYSQEIRSYSFLLLATAACFWFAEGAVREERSRRSLIWLTLSAVVAAHCHVVGLLIYPMVVIHLLIRSEGSVRRRCLWWPSPVAWLVAVLPVVWLARHWSPIHAANPTWWVPPMTWSHGAGLARVLFGVQPLRGFCDPIQTTPLTMWALFGVERCLVAIPAILALAGLANRETRRQAIALAAAAVGYVVLLLIASAASAPGTAIRTLLPVWIPIVLLMGIGATAASHMVGRRFLAVAGATLALGYAGVWLGYVYWGPDRRPPDRAPYEWLRGRFGSDDLIVVHPALFEDEVVYYLGSQVAADQLFTIANPVYTGQPPVHGLVARTFDPGFKDRLRTAVEHGLHGGGRHGAVWVVSTIAGGEQVMLDALDAVLRGRYIPADSTSSRDERGIGIQEYRPAITP